MSDIESEPSEPNEDDDDSEDERLWLEVRTQFIDRVARWVDAAGETEEGRCQIADIVDQFESAGDEELPIGFLQSYDLIQQTINDLAGIAGDLTALRHDLKSQTKSNREIVQQVAGDAQRIVTLGDRMIEKLDSIPIASDRDQIRPYVTMVIEADESVLRFRDAVDGLLNNWPQPPEAEKTWLGKKAVARNHAAWETLWGKQIGTSRGLAEGLRMTVERLTGLLEKHQIERIGEVGDAFDSATMQVLEVVDRPDVSPGSVVQVLRQGYRQGNWIVRPAQVATSRA